MAVQIATAAPGEIAYPDSDGMPMSDNTLQFNWIVLLKEGMEYVFRDDPDVFVAGDLLWYPVEGRPDIRVAPDTMIAFGRPKGYRGSYMQWRESDVVPAVVFEVLSPGNSRSEMRRKFAFYDRYGVDEYYVYDPDNGVFSGWTRVDGTMRAITEPTDWTSPRLGVRFVSRPGGDMQVFGPDGSPFESYTEARVQRDRIAGERDRIAADRDRLADALEVARRQAEALAARLRALGIDTDSDVAA